MCYILGEKEFNDMQLLAIFLVLRVWNFLDSQILADSYGFKDQLVIFLEEKKGIVYWEVDY